jgi:hypothetical protein
MFWLTAFGAGIFRRTPRFRLHRLAIQPIGSIWKLVSDYSSATASDLHGVPFHDLLSMVDSQRTGPAIGVALAGSKRFVGPMAVVMGSL